MSRGIAGPGDFIGFLAMLNHFPYEQTVVVPEEAEEDALTFRRFVDWSAGSLDTMTMNERFVNWTKQGCHEAVFFGSKTTPTRD